MLPSIVFSSMLVFASIAAPQAGGTAQPAPAPAPSATLIPEIGRVRSAAPPCTVLREVIVPSFLAARKADARYTNVSKYLAKYVDISDDRDNRFGPIQQMWLHRLDSEVANMTTDVQTLTKALRDPRLSSNDPQIVAQRAQLEQLQETQLARQSVLFEFVQREQVAMGLHEFEAGSKGFNGGTNQATQRPTPDPGPTRYNPVMPHLTGESMTDANLINDWSGGIAAEIRASEDMAARTFIGVQRSCGL